MRWSGLLHAANYELYEQGCKERALLPGDDEVWQGWLATHTSFSFQGRSGQINLLKEARKNKGEGYWYAYRRHEKRVVKRYVGRSSDLSLTRLEAIAQACNGNEMVFDSVQSQPLLAPKLRLPLMMMRAYALSKQITASRQMLQLVLTLTQREGYQRLFLDEGDALAALLRTHIAHVRG